MSERFEEEFQAITTYLANNVEITKVVEMNFEHAAFFSEFSGKIGGDDNIDGSVGWFRDDKGICLRGRLSFVEKGTEHNVDMLCIVFNSLSNRET